MAQDTSIARRYVRALAELAEDTDATGAVGRDLRRARDFFTGEAVTLAEALANPGFTVEERHGVLAAVLPRADLHPYVQNLLYILLDNGRFRLLSRVAEVWQDWEDKRAGRLRAELTAAVPLEQDLRDEFNEALSRATGKPVVMREQVDSSLIAGLVVQVGDRVYDASLRTRLESMKNLLLESDPGTTGESASG